MKGCRNCTNKTNCNSCTTLYFLKEGQCLFCKDELPNCLTCYNQSYCKICSTAYYISNSSHTCLLCSEAMAECYLC